MSHESREWIVFVEPVNAELEEMARIKAWLFLTRGTTRDLLDTLALLEKVGELGLKAAFSEFDPIYERGPGGGPPLVELIDRLAAFRVSDEAEVDLGSYKGLRPPWNDRAYLENSSRLWAGRLTRVCLGS